jgi:hypothetical protein
MQRADDHDLVLPHYGERTQDAACGARERRRGRPQRKLILGRCDGERGDQQATPSRVEAGSPGGGEPRAGYGLASREQILEEIASNAVALGEEQLLGF